MSMNAQPFDLQILNTLAALLLLLSFAMLSQRRIVTLVNLLALQGALLCIATLLLAWRTGANHLYLSAALTLALKVIVLPWLLHRLIRKLGVYWDTEPLFNITGTMLIGVPVRSNTTTVFTRSVFVSASSTFFFSGTGDPRRQPPSAVMMISLLASSTRSAIACDENPPKITLCGAPIRAHASIATTASGIIGM